MFLVALADTFCENTLANRFYQNYPAKAYTCGGSQSGRWSDFVTRFPVVISAQAAPLKPQSAA